MGFVWLALRKRPCTNIIFYQCHCWSDVYRWCNSISPNWPSARGDTIRFLSQSLQGPWFDHRFLLSSSVAFIMTLQETNPWHTTGGWPKLSWVRAVEAGGWRASCWCGGRSRAIDSETWPCSAPLLWVRLWVQKTEVSYREQGMSIHSPGLNQELCPAQRWPVETEQVSRASLLLLATDLRVKAAALIRGGILHWKRAWKVPISWN